MKKATRFEVVLTDGDSPLKTGGLRTILVDRETGVQYLTWQSGYAGGITPLLDESGKPIIAKPEK